MLKLCLYYLRDMIFCKFYVHISYHILSVLYFFFLSGSKSYFHFETTWFSYLFFGRFLTINFSFPQISSFRILKNVAIY